MSLPRPKLLREWVGLRCRLVRAVRWQWGASFPPGTIVTVEATAPAAGAVRVEAPCCSTCGVALFGNVSTDALEPIERVAPPSPARSRR